MNSIAASCWNLNRSRMLLLVSIRTARRRGRSRFGNELHDLLRLLFFQDLEVFLLQVGDKAALLVRDGEQHVDAVHIQSDSSIGVSRRLRLDLLVLGLNGKNKGAQEPRLRTTFSSEGVPHSIMQPIGQFRGQRSLQLDRLSGRRTGEPNLPCMKEKAAAIRSSRAV